MTRAKGTFREHFPQDHMSDNVDMVESTQTAVAVDQRVTSNPFGVRYVGSKLSAVTRTGTFLAVCPINVESDVFVCAQ